MTLHSDPKPAAPNHFAYIDALRGYAILGVMIVHTGLCSPRAGPATAWGSRGVQLFFVISALTLTLTWRVRADGALPFLTRRMFRIAPMFWCALVYYLAPWGTVARPDAPDGIHAWQIILTAAFLHGLHPEAISSIVPGGWSIADEVLFYAAFPLLVATLTTWGRAAPALVCAVAISTLWLDRGITVVQAVAPHEPKALLFSFVFLSIPAQLAAFASGFFAYHTIRKLGGRWRPAAYEAALISGLLGLAWMFFSDVHNLPVISILFGLVAASMGLGAGRYLVNPLIGHLGKVSYSAYFVHFALLNGAGRLVAQYRLSGFEGFALGLLPVPKTLS